MPDNSSSTGKPESTEHLLAAREDVAAKLYNSKPESPEHHALERRFNEIDKELFVREGSDASRYKYKHDMRHCFDFKEEKDASGAITEVTAQMKRRSDGQGEYTLRPVDEVINWRNTKIGERKDAELRKSLGKENLDDAGHLIALDFGTDPAERRNIAAQNCVQNEAGGTWYQAEQRLKSVLQSHRDCKLRVNVKYTTDVLKPRSFSWHMDASGYDKSGKPVVFNGNVYHFNPVLHAGSRRGAFDFAGEAKERARKANFSNPPKLRVV